MLHANNANQALDRIVNFLPEDRCNQLLPHLSQNSGPASSGRLIKTVNGKRAAAIEILLDSLLMQDSKSRGDAHEIKAVMEKSETPDMQTFDRPLDRSLSRERPQESA